MASLDDWHEPPTQWPKDLEVLDLVAIPVARMRARQKPFEEPFEHALARLMRKYGIASVRAGWHYCPADPEQEP